MQLQVRSGHAPDKITRVAFISQGKLLYLHDGVIACHSLLKIPVGKQLSIEVWETQLGLTCIHNTTFWILIVKLDITRDI